MINSVSNTSFLRQSAVPLSTAAKDLTFAQSLASTSSDGTLVTISNDAKAKSATQTFDFDVNYNNIDHTQEEFKAHYAEGARLISEMQGLPEGQFDFTRISAKQAQVILKDAVLNHGASLDNTGGLQGYRLENVDFSGKITVSSEIPKDAIAHIKTQLVSTPGVDGGAFRMPQETLDWLQTMQSHAASKVEMSVNDVLSALSGRKNSG